MKHQTLRRVVLALFTLSVLGGVLLVNEQTGPEPQAMAFVYMPYLPDLENKAQDKAAISAHKKNPPPCKVEQPAVQTHKTAPRDPIKLLLRGIMI